MNREGVPSPREIEIVRYVAAGLNNAQIADELHLSVNTVQDHVRNARYKAGARNRVQLVVRAIRVGWIDIEEILSVA